MAIQPVYVNTKELIFSRYHSNQKADYASGVTAITLYSISQFAIDQVLLIGSYGSEGSEIIKTHASTTPTGFTVTLASATAKPHTKDTPVNIIAFDQVEFSHADTLTGVKTVLATTDIDPEEDEMHYDDTTNTSGYYFTRYKNTITSKFSGYSDGIPYDGMPQNTVGYAIDTAMNELNVRFTEKLTFGMMLSFSKQMLKLVRGKLIKWSKNQEFDYNVGTMSMGVRSFSMPSTIYDPNSNRSILNLRVGDNTPLTFIDRSEYLQATEDANYTEVATQAEIAATSLVLDDTSDLEDDGSVNVFVSGTKYTIAYTVNTRSTNTLTIAADQVTVALPVDSPVWQDIVESTPQYYSVWDGYIYPWPMITSDFEGLNLTMDFYTDIETIDSQMDIIKGVKFDMLIPYLKFKIRAITENNGKEDLEDPSYAEFRELLNDEIKNDRTAEIEGFRPRGKVIYGGRESLSKR